MRKSICALAALSAFAAGAAEYFVAGNGDDEFDGSAAKPWRTIQRAADVAKAGDTVTIREGVYREWVKPANAGREDAPVVYRAANAASRTRRRWRPLRRFRRRGMNFPSRPTA